MCKDRNYSVVSHRKNRHFSCLDVFQTTNTDVSAIAPRKEGGWSWSSRQTKHIRTLQMPATLPLFCHYMPHGGIDIKGGSSSLVLRSRGKAILRFSLLQWRDFSHTRTGSSEVAAGGELAGVGYGEALRRALRLSRSVARIWSSFPLRTRCSS